jgi:hypothetical protein
MKLLRLTANGNCGDDGVEMGVCSEDVASEPTAAGVGGMGEGGTAGSGAVSEWSRFAN